MTEDDIFKISQRLCERGLLRCAGIDGGLPRFELTQTGWLALLRVEKAGAQAYSSAGTLKARE